MDAYTQGAAVGYFGLIQPLSVRVLARPTWGVGISTSTKSSLVTVEYNPN